MTIQNKPQAVLAYHEVMPESNYAYCVTSEAFAGHLKLLQACEAEGYGLQITFDDGEQSQQIHAGPLLAQYGFAATYFVTPGLIGTAGKFLGWKQLAQLRDAGHSVQSHGWSHTFLTFCNDEQLAHELSASREVLEQKLGTRVDSISIPGGRWDRRVLRAAARAGYAKVFVSEPWLDREIDGVLVVGRFMVRKTTSLDDLRRIVQRDPAVLWRLKARARVRKSLVSLVGDERYHRLWCRMTGYNEFEELRESQYS
jgi:peptidoglycan/xylan/chitin deacetylase (PgdA/CDA1 family)